VFDVCNYKKERRKSQKIKLQPLVHIVIKISMDFTKTSREIPTQLLKVTQGRQTWCQSKAHLIYYATSY